MPGEGGGSVTAWLGELKAGGDAAARPLLKRYFGRLVQLARKRLRDAPRAVFDEEDAAQSAFASFCRRAQEGRFPRLEDRDDLWRILVVITQRKVADQIRYGRARRRGGGNVHGGAAPDGAGRDLGQLAGPELPPDLIATLREEFLRRLKALGDKVLVRIALLRLEGYTDDEIAALLGCTRRCVQRKLALIRQEWSAEAS